MITDARRRAAIVTAAGLVILAACGSPQSAATSDRSGAATIGQAPGYTTLLQTVLQDLVTSMVLPSAVVVVRSSTFGDATFEFGTRELGRDDPPTTADHYRIGSLTKTMTATVILQLIQEGELSLDDPISRYRPDVPNGDNITIANLLDMRSGLPGYDLDPVFLRAVDEKPERIWSPDDLLVIGYSEPALFAPGTAYDYSNTNYILLGLVMEQVTGKTAGELFKERLIDPLGLEDTTLPTLDDASIPSVHAHGYMFTTAEKGGGPDPALTPGQQLAAAGGELLPTDWSAANPSWGWTAGSVISTADDLVVWADAVVDGRLLSPDMHERRMASYQPMNPTRPDGVAYGSGMLRAGDYHGHAGLIFGYNTQFLRDPQTDTTIVVLTGLTLAPDGRLPVEPLVAAVIDQL
jgi:D-alanyl-D-alanine carboxypeptidase